MLKNRIAKAAMEENMAGDGRLPDERMFTLYRRWAAGAGLLDIVRAVRAVVSPAFAVAVKLNSADFQRGGFDADDDRDT
ncbi:hypothetical protein GCM10010377_48830 [Streptomyces viridiviolaceus]|uniref:Uncharacterized protein n=1 Tax=Streptomyces viridiviolaceus TaxID=68282 RepID=A0ABW2E491_9ACTN|nr:hypothetical protein [Streptomyces viridiviolaceus]GHB51968.1 hypothetical protein GCM10010377_48830 [Streptomyces viridiviolaceus]